jgi:hypothetical protein
MNDLSAIDIALMLTEISLRGLGLCAAGLLVGVVVAGITGRVPPHMRGGRAWQGKDGG